MSDETERSLLWGGACAAAVLPILAIAVDVPFLVAVPAALAAGAGVGLLARRRSRSDAFDVAKYGRGKAEAVRQLVREAEGSIEAIRESAKRSGEDRPALEGLATHAATILDGLVANPENIASSRRFLAYYLPQAAILSQALATVTETGHLDPERSKTMRDTLDRLSGAFRQFSKSSAESDLGPIDIQMRLLNKTLDQDFAVPVPRETLEYRR